MPADNAPQDVRAVVFDFDGTLADSYAAITASVNHVRAQHRLPPLELKDVKRHVGRGTDHLLERTVGSGDVQGDLALYRQHHPSVMRTHTHLLPGAAAVLEAVKQTGRRAAICSNKPHEFTVELLTTLHIAKWVDVVIGPEDVPHPKPAPDMLVLALDRFGVPASQALYLGDMTVDIEAARAAGIAVWVVPTGSDTLESLRQARPDRVLGELSELAAWLSAHR